ncbi:hypothetical protein ACISOF_08680, partial [Campylobacter jejuni]
YLKKISLLRSTINNSLYNNVMTMMQIAVNIGGSVRGVRETDTEELKKILILQKKLMTAQEIIANIA